jgi:hypothetical protein
MSEQTDRRRTLIAAVLGMGAGGLASTTLPLSLIPKAIAVGLIAAAVFAFLMAITRSWQSPSHGRP